MKRIGALILAAVLVCNMFGDFTGLFIHHLSHSFDSHSEHHTHIHAHDHSHDHPHVHHHGEDHDHGQLVNFFLQFVDFDQSEYPVQQAHFSSLWMMTIHGCVPQSQPLPAWEVEADHSISNILYLPISISNFDIPTPPPRYMNA